MLATEHPEVKARRTRDEAKREAERRKALYLKHLAKNLGLVSHACEATGIPHSEYRHWYSSDPDFKERVLEISKMQCDYVEGEALKKIKDGSERMMMFYLDRKGQQNGYRSPSYSRGEILDGQRALPSSADKDDTDSGVEESLEKEMDDDALVTAMRIAEERAPGLFAKGVKPVLLDMEVA